MTFRSRLEARWAVFFDALGIAWAYEPEGYEVGTHTETFRYLPDFWLPGPKIWVEVKGSISAWDWRKIASAVIPHRGLPSCTGERNEPRLLLLSDVPRGDALHVHRWLRFHKGDIYVDDVSFLPGDLRLQLNGWIVGNDSNYDIDLDGSDPGGFTVTGARIAPAVAAAYRAARNERFGVHPS